MFLIAAGILVIAAKILTNAIEILRIAAKILLFIATRFSAWFRLTKQLEGVLTPFFESQIKGR